jgi:N-carbamoyl-L-amino-acid hydrolase
MIFIRNENGSHNPHEAMEIDDFMAGMSLLTWYIMQQYSMRPQSS